MNMCMHIDNNSVLNVICRYHEETIDTADHGCTQLVDKEKDSATCVWTSTENSGEVKSMSKGTSSKDSPSDKKVTAGKLPTADSSPGIPRRLVCNRLQKCLRMETKLVSNVR